MAKSTHKNQDRKIAEAALRLAAGGWEKVTLEQVAKAAKIPAAETKKRFADTADLLPLIVGYVTHQAMSLARKPTAATPLHDRLFDALMARFDVLQNHRKAFLSLAESGCQQPKIALKVLPAQHAAMQETLKFVDARGTKFCNNLPPLGLMAIYMAAFAVWRRDEALDMSKTMAALDRYLRYAARAATLLRAEFT